MKFSILALGAAVAGISSQCAAQLHIEPSFPSRAPEARLISQQEPVGTSSADELSGNQEDSTYFAPTPPQAEITRNQIRDSQKILNESENNDQDIAADEESLAPAGKPISKNITPGAPLHVLEMTPEVGMVPVCWQNAGCPTPNPIADYMRQNWCTNGLWDTYPCQRVRQCAHIQQHIFGHNRYTCGGCAACGVAAHHSGRAIGSVGCSSCASASQCAQNTPVPATSELKLPTSSLMAAAPATQSPYIGELQAGLPVLDMSQLPLVPPPGYGQPAAQLTNTPTNRLPNGQPLLQLPADVPTVPQDAVAPSASQGVMPALPVPTAAPVVASRQAVSLR